MLKHAEYCTANAGVVGLTGAAAKKLFRYGITCNAFSSFARTRAAFDEAVSEEKSPVDGPKVLFPPEATPSHECIAPFIIYLASDAAAKTSGSVFSMGENNIGLHSEPEIARSLVKFDEAP